MSLRITAFNALNAFGDPARSAQAVDMIVELAPDIAVFGEAYDLEPDPTVTAQTVEHATDAFLRAGYEVAHTPYDDADHYGMLHGIMAVSRLPWIVETVPVEQRNSLDITTSDPETGRQVQLLGVHFDHKSEARRLRQAEQAVAARRDPLEPFVIVGDMNTLHRRDWRAAMLRTRMVRMGANIVPTARWRGYAKDLCGMSEGTALAHIESAGLQDADPAFEPTMMARLPLVQLDHIMISDQLSATSFERHGYSPLSDHRAISAVLEVR
ncbi:hypothetical protein EKI60_03255 [Candidatus Saccharibacteria bacterium]|nr:MAG: hypothetical protein EKI60_03255 [Candidatus Saccharibacteria bacterium]